MRILHTSDWHLGASLEDESRLEEQSRFLDWILETGRDRTVDALLLAGDVFQHPQPSAEAQSLYYGFLAQAAERKAFRRIVVAGGNHDSASRLDAPAQVLRTLDVHVVGGLPEDRNACLIPLEGDGGQVETVVAAVPFVHEYRLGVRIIESTTEDARVSLREAFAGLYRSLAEEAAARWPGVPLVGMGHLACGDCQKGDTEVDLHQVGTLDVLPADLFDSRYTYVALGHIHRPFRVGCGPARYSGSPLALRMEEASIPRRVLLVDIAPDGTATVEDLHVPVRRKLVELKGTLEEVEKALVALEWETEFSPLVQATVEVEGFQPEVEKTLRDALDKFQDGRRPRLIRICQEAVSRPGEAAAETKPARSLAEADPRDVFAGLYASSHQNAPLPYELRLAFEELLAEARSGR